uniref:Uncharacterized protein n=1 Tax=Loa loa TaxID=7209 RepID=A0A1I7VKM5_LOALO
MNIVQNDDAHCSVISLVKKGYEIVKRFVIKKPIPLDSFVSDGDIPVTPDDLLSSIEEQSDFIFDVGSGRTYSLPQYINYVNDQEDDDDLMIMPNTEIDIRE